MQPTLMRAALVRHCFGDVSNMSNVRRLKADPTFPRPISLGMRKIRS
jgi:hypothetical protein